MYMIKKLGILSIARITGALYFVMGLLIVPLAFMMLIMPMMSGRNAEERTMFGGIGFVFLLVPVFYGAIGFVAGALLALFYNLISPKIGGIEVELELKSADNNLSSGSPVTS